MGIEIFVQARMGSERLPGKVLKEVLHKPLLAYQIERLQRAREASAIVILTTTAPKDDPIVQLCATEQIDCFRGPENDVLSRYYLAAKKRKPEAIVRVTADCPLIDPEIVDLVIATYREALPQWDYVSNSLIRSFPRGLDVEIFSFAALEEVHRLANKESEREHVTPYIYHHPERYRLKNVAAHCDLSSHRWTVDTVEDFELINLLLAELYPTNPNFVMRDVLELCKKHPEWSLINRHIRQKS
jgi:spore coat polysaccharide biosynthesis protein SpsF